MRDPDRPNFEHRGLAAESDALGVDEETLSRSADSRSRRFDGRQAPRGDDGSPGWAVVAVSYAWALTPLVSFSLLTPLTFGYAFVRLRTRGSALTAAAYCCAFGLIMTGTLDRATAGNSGGWIVLTTLIATAHALAIRRSVFGLPPPRRWESRNDWAVRRARTRRLLRRRALTLITGDPSLAQDLGIGRPDLGLEYDDGGLVDVNHAPAAVIARVPGITPDLVDRIVEVRAQHGSFISAEELSAAADLPPQLTAQLKEYTVYLPDPH